MQYPLSRHLGTRTRKRIPQRPDGIRRNQLMLQLMQPPPAGIIQRRPKNQKSRIRHRDERLERPFFVDAPEMLELAAGPGPGDDGAQTGVEIGGWEVFLGDADAGDEVVAEVFEYRASASGRGLRGVLCCWSVVCWVWMYGWKCGLAICVE